MLLGTLGMAAAQQSPMLCCSHQNQACVALHAGPRLKDTAEAGHRSDAVSSAARKPWLAPDLYAQIVKAGLDGARALAAHDNGRLRMVANAYVRIDVVLAMWEKVNALASCPAHAKGSPCRPGAAACMLQNCCDKLTTEQLLVDDAFDLTFQGVQSVACSAHA